MWVKDESYRFGLNAFKSLGASWAIANVISEIVGIPKDKLTFDLLTSAEVREKFATTTYAILLQPSYNNIDLLLLLTETTEELLPG